jgi:hypothetical protein
MNASTFSQDDEVAAIARGLFERTLPKARWTHRAHFAAAIWVLMRRPELEAEAVLPRTIRAYNESTGVANTHDGGYHETITLASIRAARAFIAAYKCDEPFRVCNALMDSSLGRSDWPLRYWSRAVLFSREARKAWVDPDLHGLPW